MQKNLMKNCLQARVLESQIQFVEMTERFMETRISCRAEEEADEKV